jgi:excisionase family DNA binding protein
MSPPVLKLAYTVREACGATGLSRSTIYNLFKSGRLRKTRVLGRTLIGAADLTDLLAGDRHD